MTTSVTSHALRVGLFFVGLFVLCLVWPKIYPYEADVLVHHLLSLQLLFPGFNDYTLDSIVWGGVLSFAYGVIGSMIFHSLHGGCCLGKK